MTKSAEYIVVGAGYAGLTAALTLARAGKDVLVIDTQPIGGSESSLPGHTQSAISGGHVMAGFSQDFQRIEKKYGRDYAQKLWDLSVEGVALVEKLSGEMGGAGFQRGYLFLARNERDEEILQSIFSKQTKYGIGESQLKPLNSNETRNFIASPDFQGQSLYSTLEGQLEPREYILGLARMAAEAGAKFLPSTCVTYFDIARDGVKLTTNKGDVFFAPKVVVSGGSAVLRSGFFPEMRKYQAVAGNYAVKTDVLPQAVIHQIFPSGYKGAFADLRRSDVLYARLDNQNRLDFGAYSFSGMRPNAEEVIALLYTTFPQLKVAGIGISEGRYGFLVGTKLETMQVFQSNGEGAVLPVRQFNPDSSLTILSAFGCQGINLGTVAGKAVAEAFLGQPNNLNLLAHIEHPLLPFTFPWESANQWRDYMFTKVLSVIDRGASQNGLWGKLMRWVEHLIL